MGCLNIAVSYIGSILADNPYYGAAAVGVTVIAAVAGYFNREEDPDLVNIRRVLERDSDRLMQERTGRTAVNFTLPTPIMTESEVSRQLKKYQFADQVPFALIIALIGAVVVLEAWQWHCTRRKVRNLQGQISNVESLVSTLKEQVESTTLETRLLTDNTLERFKRDREGKLNKEVQKVEDAVRTGLKRIDTQTSKNSDKIDRAQKGFIDLIETDDKVRRLTVRMRALEESLEKTSRKYKAQFESLDEHARGLNTKIHKYKDEAETMTVEVYKNVDLMKVNAFKSNIQLVNSQILFDASLSKFELVERSLKTLLGHEFKEEGDVDVSGSVDDELNPQERLERCLQGAIQTRKRLDLLHSKRNNEVAESSQLSQVLEVHFTDSESESYDKLDDERISFEYFKIYSDATDLAIADLNDKLEKMELRVQRQACLAKSPPIPPPKPLDDWINDWLSAMYALFNSDIVSLQSQMFGDSQMEGLELLHETGCHLQSKYLKMSDFVDECKEVCLKLMNQISFVVLESHMVGNRNDSYILSECKDKIGLTLSDVFQRFLQETYSSVPKDEEDQRALEEILRHFKNRLETDLNSAASNYLGLFRQNTDDFYLIQESLKGLKGSESAESSEDKDQSDESLISTTPLDVSADSNDTNDSILSTSSWEKGNKEVYRKLRLVEARKSGKEK